jgi:deoxyribodipyrimidine photolyase-related protein
MRHLVIILGDQLDRSSHALADFDREQDVLWMAEVAAEATHVWSHKARIAVFLSAMRHFAAARREEGFPLIYHALDDAGPATLHDRLRDDLSRMNPRRVVIVQPGEHRVRRALHDVVIEHGAEWVERPDAHFLVDGEDFADWARGKQQLRMETFYRWMRRRLDVLMSGADPEGGAWNYDTQNRGSFGRQGPGWLPEPQRFLPDDITAGVIALVQERFADHPGALEHFDWPVTPEHALQALDDFIEHRLAAFGRWQDAMWSDQPWLYHARLSVAMNLKLISPRLVIDRAVQAYKEGKAPLPSVEGFVRQVLGWREFVRGVYWLAPERLLNSNALKAHEPLPWFYWSGDTDMNCIRQVVGQTLALGYAHHIQRLMVTGTLALMLGVEPTQVHAWYLAVYVDAVEWVEAPNTLGMSQFADGGRMVSKPYAASGKYIDRMSDYCRGCRYRPDRAVGDDACPFTTLYWDFLDRHNARFEHHPRAALQWRSLQRLSKEQRVAIRTQADALRASWRAQGPAPRSVD